MMKEKNKILACMTALAFTFSVAVCTAFAVEESEVEQAVAATSREEVSGNILIWFLCAIAFLKISQKIDSFMSSLGVNVGRTGGSMLAELMIAGRAITGAAGATGHAVTNAFTRHHGGTHTAAGETFVSNQMGTGAINMAQKAERTAAAAAATGQGTGLGAVIGGKMFQSSLDKGGCISTDVIHSVATGSISRMGLMAGAQAAQALTTYMGYPTGHGTKAGSKCAEAAGDAGARTVTGGAIGGAQMPVRCGEEVLSGTQSSEDFITLDGGIAGGLTKAQGSVPQAAGHGALAGVQGYGSGSEAPTFSKVEIGGGRISGCETPVGGGEDQQFAMYNASQYMEPTGDYEMVRTVDGENWYKQYAQPTVEKTPVEVDGRGIQYDEEIVMRMPPVPKRKDKI